MSDKSKDEGNERRRRRVTKKIPKDELPGDRGLTKKVKTARKRKLSSTLWLQRQLNDPYVQQAQKLGYRSRAAFKLIELDDRFELIPKGGTVVDLGAAPGGWSQIAMARGAGRIVGIDILPVDPMAGLEFIEMDFMDEEAPLRLKEMLGGEADFVMSDLAANTTGHRKTDHLRTVALVEAAAHFALEVLAEGGSFVTKVFQGGAEKTLLEELRRSFEIVKHAKPKSSRDSSPEMYLVAKGFKKQK